MTEVSNWSTTASGNATQGNIDWTPDAARIQMLENGKEMMAANRRALDRQRETAGLDGLTEDEAASVQGYTASLDLTAKLNSSLNASWTQNRDTYLNAGAYLTTGLTLPGNAAGRTKAYELSGQGTGEIFARGFTGGTIIASTTNAPVLKYTPDAPLTGPGTLNISKLRLEGNSATPVVDLGSFIGQSEFYNNAIYQAGTGDGLISRWSNTTSFHDSYAINRDWATFGLGAARTGAGFRIVQAYEAGLTKVYNTTSRGFLRGYVLGDSLVAGYLNTLDNFEVSVCRHGVIVNTLMNKTVVSRAYMEGIDGGTGFENLGLYTTFKDFLMFPGAGIGIDDTAATTKGTAIRDGVVSAGSVANTKLVRIGAGAGGAKVLDNVTMTFSGSGGTIPGVVGLTLTGQDLELTWNTCTFDPPSNWVGGAGTRKIDNQTTSGDGTTGYGLIGMGLAVQRSGNNQFPYLYSGGIGLKVDPTTLTNADIVGGVLTIGELSVFTLTLSSAANITSIAAPNLPSKTFQIHCTGGANVPTFVNGALLKLRGSLNHTVGANGCWLTFQVKPGGVCWLVSREDY